MFSFFRMLEKLHAIQHWSKLQVTWNQLVVCKCELDVPYEAIWPKFMPCIGDRILGIEFKSKYIKCKRVTDNDICKIIIS